jgi:hypothetical protein
MNINKDIHRKLKKMSKTVILKKNKYRPLKSKKIVDNSIITKITHNLKIYMISIEFQNLTEANRKIKMKIFSIFPRRKIYNLEAIQILKNMRLKLKSSLKWRIMDHHSKTWNLEKIVWLL